VKIGSPTLHVVVTAASGKVHSFIKPISARFLTIEASVDSTYGLYSTTGATVTLAAPTTAADSVITEAGYGEGNIARAATRIRRIPVDAAAKLGMYLANGTVVYLEWS
jgi:hypothetical protein